MIRKEIKRRRDKRVWYLLVAIFVTVFFFTFLAQAFKNIDDNVNAANLAAFDPGYIISDYQMSNYGSMSESQIQSFLKSKNSCWDADLGRYTAGDKVSYFSEISPPRTWHIKDGHFVCMADEVFDGGTAAHIIYQAAQDYRINPQVLLVLLEKEQSLVTDTFPHSQQYRSATGYGCPDTAACSSKYYGLKNQIRNAAALFRDVLDGGWTNYPLGNNYIQYNPSASCGGSVVNIRNLATSALYRYTPYQPNAATLGGWSDRCSAYGNLNFYKLFEDWFGGILHEQKSTKVPDGVYYIQPSSNDSMVIDVRGASVSDGANIQLGEKKETSSQQWEIVYNEKTDDYTITNLEFGKVLDVDSAGVENGTNIQLWESNGTCAQRWKIIEVDGEIVKLVSACSTKVIDISNGMIVDGTNITLWADNGTVAQKWKLMPAVSLSKDGLYTIRSAINDENVLDISGGVINAMNGTNIQVWAINNTGAQRWRIESASDGYYTIRNLQSNKILDVAAALNENGTNIQTWVANGTCAQKWRILKNEDDTYSFISACFNRVLDLAGGSGISGGNVQIYSANNTKAQRWILEEINLINDDTYRIVSGLSNNKVIDIAGNRNMNGTNIQIYDSNNTNAQRFRVSYDKNTDYYSIINPFTQKLLDVAAAGVNEGTNIHLWENNQTCAQKWSIYEEDDGYVIASACSNLVLDVRNAEMKNGANIQLWKKNGTAAQKWMMVND